MRKKNIFGCCKLNSNKHFIPILFRIHSLQLQIQQKSLLKKDDFQHYLSTRQNVLYGLCGFWQKADRFGRISWSQIEKDNQKYLLIQMKVFRKDDRGDFRRHKQIKLGVFDFKQLLCLRNPIAQAVREFSTDETLKEVVT